MDTYRELAADMLVPVILVRNVMAFAVNYGIDAWIAGMGRGRAFGLAAGLSGVCGVLGLGWGLLGGWARGRSGRSYWRLVGG